MIVANIITNVIIAVVASVLAIIIFQGLQYAYFSDVMKDIGSGNYTTKFVSVQIQNITYEHVSLSINGERCPNLKEGEQCKSGCVVLTIFDIKNNVVDIDITDDIICEIQRNAFNFGKSSIEGARKSGETIENVTSEWMK
jgi:hypothetical protein